MIRDWEIPSVGQNRMAGAMTKIWRKAQDTLLHGSPLLVDAKGQPATELRTGGFADQPEWGDLEWEPRILGADGKPAQEGYTFTVDMPSQVLWQSRAEIRAEYLANPWWRRAWWTLERNVIWPVTRLFDRDE